MSDQNIVGKQDLAPEKDLEIVFDIHCLNSVFFLFRTSKMEYIIETEGFFFSTIFSHKHICSEMPGGMEEI